MLNIVSCSSTLSTLLAAYNRYIENTVITVNVKNSAQHIIDGIDCIVFRVASVSYNFLCNILKLEINSLAKFGCLNFLSIKYNLKTKTIIIIK